MADFSAPRAAAYTASKAALRQMAKTAAVELGPLGITVNVIQPGWIDTPGERRSDPDGKAMADVSTRLPLRRMGSPADIANLACFLASDAAAYITGSTFDCDGGYKVAMSI
jgi:glucose 1-dehydrogenase